MQNFKSFNALNLKGFEISYRIQSLWSGYGQIVRLKNKEGQSLVAKHINPPSQNNHPRGWNTNVGHQRKLQSYINELNFYQAYANQTNEYCKVPKLISSESINNEHLIILEDLTASGFPKLHSSINLNQIKVVLKWLANFHAVFINNDGKDLGPIGTYWHLNTRLEEYEIMEESPLKDKAFEIDERLNNCQYQTIVHGDAKLANFCFSDAGDKVSAVDFQYVGKGCGIKDVIYFLGSCLSDRACEQLETELLSYYFKELKVSISNANTSIEFDQLEKEWRALYAFAWADFHRFLLGWMPSHQKLTAYSQKQVEITLKFLL